MPSLSNIPRLNQVIRGIKITQANTPGVGPRGNQRHLPITPDQLWLYLLQGISLNFFYQAHNYLIITTWAIIWAKKLRIIEDLEVPTGIMGRKGE